MEDGHSPACPTALPVLPIRQGKGRQCKNLPGSGGVESEFFLPSANVPAICAWWGCRGVVWEGRRVWGKGVGVRRGRRAGVKR